VWDGLAARLEGEIVVLEPLAAEHEQSPYETARGMDWSLMFVGDDRTGLRDSAFSAIVDDDWSAVKVNLLRRLGR
jgi:hypothetical protein